MKKIKDVLPILLTTTVVPYFFYADPNIAQSIISVGLVSLLGFKYYLDHQELPNYEKVFEERLNEMTKESLAKHSELKKEVDILKTRIGNVGMIKKGKEAAPFEIGQW